MKDKPTTGKLVRHADKLADCLRDASTIMNMSGGYSKVDMGIITDRFKTIEKCLDKVFSLIAPDENPQE